MIETLGSATRAKEGAIVGGYDLEITGIRFEDGDLSRPRYLSLFDYERAPELVTFEPCVQIRKSLPAGQTLRFLFQIDGTTGVRFQVRNEEPVVVSAVDPDAGPVSGLTARLPDPLDPLTCELVWDPSLASPDDAKVAALRLLCEVPGRTPTAWETVYGGLYLAIVNRPKDVPDGGFGIGDPGDREAGTIKLLGVDQQGRTVYDLFQRGALSGMPDYLTLEPAFRVTRDVAAVELAIQLAPPLEVLLFKAETADPQEVQVISFKPEEWPEQLKDAHRLDDGILCRILWVPEPGDGMQPGDSSAFYLEVMRNDIGPSVPGTRFLQIDPTVIQPPSCTGGICV